jgi:hypothetical protein
MEIVEPLDRHVDALDATAVHVAQNVAGVNRAAARVGLDHPHGRDAGLVRKRHGFHADRGADRIEHRCQVASGAGRGSNAITDRDDASIAIVNSLTSAPRSSETRFGSHSDATSCTSGRDSPRRFRMSYFRRQYRRGAKAVAVGAS